MGEFEIIRVERESVSDDHVLIDDLPVPSGSAVTCGQVIAVVETSKAAVEITSPADGYVFYRLKTGDRLAIGEVLAFISSDHSFEFPDDPKASAGSAGHQVGGARFSKRARQLIEEHDLDPAAFAHLPMVREVDVLKSLSRACTPPSSLTVIDEGALAGKPVIVFGAGGHAAMCIDILRQMKRYPIEGLVVDTLEPGTEVMGLRVLGRTDDLPTLRAQGIELIVNGLGALEKPSLRRHFFDQVKECGFIVPRLVHPTAAVEPSAQLGEGCQIMAQAAVGSLAKIGDNCIVNTGAVVSHGSVLEADVHVTPGALLAGNVHVGRGAVIGMGSTIYLRVRIGRHAIIHNGCHITRDVADDAVVMR